MATGATKLSQADRIGKLFTPLGADVLLLRGIEGAEHVDDLFEFRVEALSNRKNIDFDKLLGEGCGVAITTLSDGAEATRHFHGIVTEGAEQGFRDNERSYTLTLRPWMWLMTLRRNQRIFHEKTPQDILDAVFADYGKPFSIDLKESYPRLEYTVQYGESDFDFVCRLMQRFGISYFFKHSQNAHQLCLVDTLESFPQIPGGSRPFADVHGRHSRPEEHFRSWSGARRMTTGKVTLTDYDFKNPKRGMKQEQSGTAAYTSGKLESFAFPGEYEDPDVGLRLAKVRVAQQAASDGRSRAEGDVLTLGAGMRVKITDHPVKTLEGETFLALRCDHVYRSEAYSTTQSGDDGPSYDGTYELFPERRSYAPAARTAPAQIFGPQTAVVVGSDDIDVDEHGRILVQFHWDRDSARSMRCRVAQMWAGKGWGGVFVPRVGMEVVVEFLGGDPSRPIVVGCVYNGDNMPPFALPAKKNEAGIKSNSTPGGGGYNELVMDDTAGKEMFRIQAQYNLDAKVLNDEVWTVGRDDSLTVGKDRATTIGAHDKLEIGQTLEIKAGTSIKLIVGTSTIEMTPSGIKLSALKIEIGAVADLKLNGTMTDLGGTAQVTIKGGVVMIN